MYTGECTCKRLVVGKDCNQCMLETYGLSDSRDGCSPCNCDRGGSFDNHCDVNSGQCKCRPHMTGRTCSTPLQNHYIPSLHRVYEAEIAICDSPSHFGNCSMVSREPPIDTRPPFTGDGYRRVSEGSKMDFDITDVPMTLPYDVVIRYSTQTSGDWEYATITLIRPDPYDPEGKCANSDPHREQRRRFELREHDTQVVAMNEVCLEQGKFYKFKIHFERHRITDDNPSAQILIDSLVLIPHIEVTPILSGSSPADERLDEYSHYRCNDTYYQVNYDVRAPTQCLNTFQTTSKLINDGATRKLIVSYLIELGVNFIFHSHSESLALHTMKSISIVVLVIFLISLSNAESPTSTACNCNPTGSLSKKCEEYGGYCQCKNNVVGRQCDKCQPGTYGFGPEGCRACDCNSIGAKDNNCDLISGQCNCVANAYGRECDQCLPGFWNFPECRMCECNGHAQVCDSNTGACHSCQDYTTGTKCDRCVEGFYGNPLLGSEIGCRPCRCPDTVSSGHTHADACTLDPRNNDMVCHCQEGYTGPRCDVCADNYFGNPEVPGGSCQRCDCSNNVDPHRPGNCDAKTGKCLQCLYNTDGENCQYCRDGYHGNALEQACQRK